jgi:hypothetical protein
LPSAELTRIGTASASKPGDPARGGAAGTTGIDPARIAEWAGHGVETLRRVCAERADGDAERRLPLRALVEEEWNEWGGSAGDGGERPLGDPTAF